jgi:hypothetical protein
MSNLSELLPTGGGQNAVDFVASGTLSSGQTVILKADGTVEAVTETAVPASVGSAAVFETAACEFKRATFDTLNNKVVIVYADEGNSGYGTAIVGTVSGTSISFGTAVIFYSGDSNDIAITFDTSNNKVVVAYSDGAASAYGKAIVGTVSGTSISFGGVATFAASLTYSTSATFDSTNNKVVIAYRDSSSTENGTAVVGTVSGTSISFGSPTVYETGEGYANSATFDSTNGKVVIAYLDNASTQGKAVVGSVSGTSISFGTAAVFNGDTQDISATFDSNSNKTVIAFRDRTNSERGTAIVGTVSGTSISFGTKVVFEAAFSQWISAIFNSTSNNVIIAYQDSGNSGYGTVVSGAVSGTSISFGTPLVFESASSNEITATYDSNSNKATIAYNDGGNSNYGTGIVYTDASTSSNNTDFIGITAEAISDTATGAVNVYGGINEAQTGLTIAADYYVQDDGSLSTTASSVKVGQAISATTINMMDLT